jgi:hypothetical protein
MPLFLFLAELFQRFGIAINLDPFYFTAVQAIGWLPAGQIASILRAHGHAVLEPVCGLTVMHHDGQFNRFVSQIWIAEPSETCPVSQLRYFLSHELLHVWTWITEGVATWPGHH